MLIGELPLLPASAEAGVVVAVRPRERRVAVGAFDGEVGASAAVLFRVPRKAVVVEGVAADAGVCVGAARLITRSISATGESVARRCCCQRFWRKKVRLQGATRMLKWWRREKRF